PMNRRTKNTKCTGADSSRQPVENVVDAGRYLAEFFVSICPVSHHGVERIRRAIQQRTRRSRDEAPEEGSDHRICRALSHAFDCGAADLGLTERSGVAADDPREAAAGRWE